MAAPSISQAHLCGSVSKPSITLPSKRDFAARRGKTYTWLSAKRKCDEADQEVSSDVSSSVIPSKKLKLCVSQPIRLTPSAKVNSFSDVDENVIPISTNQSAHSDPGTSLVAHNLSQSAQTLVTLHKFFLKALSFYYAHNGAHAPAELKRLLDTITKLWKERSVSQVDLQRMLAMYEIRPDGKQGEDAEIIRSLSPFKLATAGSVISVEFTERRNDVGGPISTLFDEKALHDFYKAHIYVLDAAWTKEQQTHLSFFGDDSLNSFPKLACDIGAHTASRKEHISNNLQDILKLSNAAQLRNARASTSVADTNGNIASNAIAVVESRIQNLRDRIKVKELASKSNAKPTSQQVLRKHALGRIDEVTEILRMMQQQQKRESKVKTHDHTMTEFNSVNGSGKVSFNLTQLQTSIRSSARVPISDAEVMMCLKLLSEELEGNWVKIVERRGALNAIFVVVQGEGMSGREAQRQLMAKQI